MWTIVRHDGPNHLEMWLNDSEIGLRTGLDGGVDDRDAADEALALGGEGRDCPGVRGRG